MALTQRVCKAFCVIVASGLLVILLLSVISEVQHVGPRRVKITSRYDGPPLRDNLGIEQLKPQGSNPISDNDADYLQARQDMLMRQCDRLEQNGSDFSSLQRARLDHIIVNDKYKVLYCYIPKVACTNLKRIFLILSGKMNVTEISDIRSSDVHLSLDKHLTYLDSLSPESIKYRLKNYRKVVFVREPLERVLSAYRNKFLQKGNEYFKKRFGRLVIKRYRDNASEKSLEDGHDMKFTEFVDYILDPRTQARGYNEHWNKYVNICSPCHVRYDFIGKYETLDKDVDLLLKQIEADQLIKFPQRGEMYKAVKTEDTLENFYQEVKPQKIKELREIYGLDYLLFGYQLPEPIKKLIL